MLLQKVRALQSASCRLKPFKGSSSTIIGNWWLGLTLADVFRVAANT